MQTSSNSHAMASGVAVDSRLLRQSDLFFALPGAQVDGHTFLEEVSLKGASGAVVLSSYHGPDFGLPLIRSPNVLASLQTLAKTLLAQANMKVVAITGSVGKTTTKDFIAGLLHRKFRVSASPGNSNSQIGLPLTILNNTDLEDDILILEMGMTHPGQITQLIDIAPPAIAVVTTVALVHACNFDSLQGIAKAKAEIFSHPDTEVGIYHLESDIGKELNKSGLCKKFSFSTKKTEADYFLRDETNSMVIKEGQEEPVELPLLNLPGTHNRHNFLAAVAVARQCGMSWNEIIEAQSSLALPERRLEIIEKFGAIFVNDSYNASEMSVKAALDALPVPKKGSRRIAVLGEMMELGKFSKQCHRSVGEHALKCVDMMICFGEGCQPIFECWMQADRHVFWPADRSGAVAALRDHLQPGDVVLLKGSRSKGVWKVLEEL